MAVGNPGQWEVVGGKTNKIKPKQTEKKTGKGGSAEKDKKTPVLKLDELVPVETRFGILDPELKEQAKQQQQKQKEKEKAKEADAKKKSEKVVAKPKETKPSQSLDEAIKELRIEQLNSVLDNVTAKFKDAPSIWLKDLVGYLNLKLSVDADPIYTGKARDYPASILPAEVRKAILGTLSSCPEAALQAFYQQFFMSISTDMNKGLHVEGTKIVLQLLSSQKPDIVLPNLSRYGEHLRSIQSRVPACQATLWVLAQAAMKNPKIGLQVFMEAMLPLLSLKNFGPFITSVAASISQKISPAAIGKESLSLSSFLKFFDLFYGIGEKLPTAVRQEIEPFFRAISNAAVQNSGSQLFTPYFNRLRTETNLQKELSGHLLELLQEAPDSAKVWVSQYKSNLPTSAVLLKYVAEHSPSLVRDVPELRSALWEMKQMNNDISPGSKNAAVLSDSILAIEVLLQNTEKKRSSKNCYKFWNYLLFLALASVVYYDVAYNGDGRFAQSRLGLAAEKYGVTERYNKAYSKAEPYVETARVKLGPYYEQAKIYAGEAYTYAYNKGEELRPGLWKELGEKWAIYSEVVKENTLFAAELTKKYATEYSRLACEKSAPYIDQAKQFTKQYVNEENVQAAWKSVNQAYHRAMHALGLCSH